MSHQGARSRVLTLRGHRSSPAPTPRPRPSRIFNSILAPLTLGADCCVERHFAVCIYWIALYFLSALLMARSDSSTTEVSCSLWHLGSGLIFTQHCSHILPVASPQNPFTRSVQATVPLSSVDVHLRAVHILVYFARLNFPRFSNAPTTRCMFGCG